MKRLFIRNLSLIADKSLHFKRTFVLLVGLLFILNGCSNISYGLGGVKKRKNVRPEVAQQKVGLFVIEKPARASYFGSASSDVSDLMSFHFIQILPFNIQSELQEVFNVVEISHEEENPAFKNPDLNGYFKVQIDNIRSDYPEAGRTNYRAEVRLLAEFKTQDHKTIWSKYLQGDGNGFSDESVSITEFGQGVSQALGDAFQDAVEELGDAVVESPVLNSYFQNAVPAQNQQNSY